MPDVRAAATRLAQRGLLEICQKGEVRKSMLATSALLSSAYSSSRCVLTSYKQQHWSGRSLAAPASRGVRLGPVCLRCELALPLQRAVTHRASHAAQTVADQKTPSIPGIDLVALVNGY